MPLGQLLLQLMLLMLMLIRAATPLECQHRLLLPLLQMQTQLQLLPPRHWH